MDRPPKYLCEFGPFRLDPVNRLLTREGQIVPLKPKIFDTLLVLVERPGQVLGKREMMERIWPDVTVEENNLNQNISALRKILGKDPDGQDYIKTIPRRGYYFTANVQEVWEENADFILEKSRRSRIIVEEEQDASDRQGEGADISIRAEALDHLPVSKPRRSRRNRKRTLIAISSVVVAAIAVVAGWILFYQPKNQNDSALLSSLSIVHIANWKSAPRGTGLKNGAFSPDGKLIAFSSNKEEHSGIWVKQIDGGDAFEVFWDNGHNESPIWSPDQNQIAFVSDRGGHAAIWSIPSFGGTLILLSTLQTGWPELKRWSKKTDAIYYELDGNLFALDLASKRTVQVTNFNPPKLSPPTFSLSPEEEWIAYADAKNGQRDIWVMPLEGGEPTQVTDDPADDRYPIWNPSDKSIIYSSNRDGGYKICIAYLDGRPPERIPLEDTGNSVSDISPDGSKILFVQAREDADLYKVQVDTGEEAALTSDFGLELWPDVSPDGKTIAYQATSAVVKMFSGSILSKPLESSGRQLQLATEGFDPRWSP
ncbi:MAG TPA: winged helix-turn-helix domain-containing protein, partial [Blastocatellia bacterium]|nr:winged helix-turn-helix domain-containing protein [Blastocatellia bacterium]